MSNTLIHFKDLRFAWSDNAAPLIECSEFALSRGEHVFIKGPSGSGKSTLLNLVAAVLTPQAGELLLLNHNTREISPARRDRLRADHVGYVFQQFNLVPYLSLLENVLLPCRFSERRAMLAGDDFGTADKAALHLLEHLFADDDLDLDTPVSKLSVGQQQRVAAARALIGKPDVLIADEPTSSLDADTRERFMQLLFEQAGAAHSTLLFVSHDPVLSRRFSRVIDMADFKSGKAA